MEEKNEITEARIRKIGVLSLANLFGFVNAILGLLFGIFFALFSSVIQTTLMGTGVTSLGMFSLGNFVWYSIIIFPIAYGILGWISGIIAAVLYNIAAKVTKGIKLYSD